QQNSKKPLRSPWQILGQLMTIMTILKWQRPEPLRRFVVKVRNRLRELNRQRSCLNGCAMTILCSWDIANTTWLLIVMANIVWTPIGRWDLGSCVIDHPMPSD